MVNKKRPPGAGAERYITGNLEVNKKSPRQSAGDVPEYFTFAFVDPFPDRFDVQLVVDADPVKRVPVDKPVENHQPVDVVMDVLIDQVTDLAVRVLHSPPP